MYYEFLFFKYRSYYRFNEGYLILREFIAAVKRVV